MHPGIVTAAVSCDEGAATRWVAQLDGCDGWQVLATSTNGMFVDGVRRRSALITGPTTIHLGAAETPPDVARAGRAVGVLQDAESERSVPPDAAAAIETLIAQLAMS